MNSHDGSGAIAARVVEKTGKWGLCSFSGEWRGFAKPHGVVMSFEKAQKIVQKRMGCRRRYLWRWGFTRRMSNRRYLPEGYRDQDEFVRRVSLFSFERKMPSAE